MSAQEILSVMPREMRMMSERIISLTALPKGFAMMVSDMVMYSQAMGLGGFALLEERLDTLREADVSQIALSGKGQRLDGGGQHAWFVVPSLIDLLGLPMEQGDEARIELNGVLDSDELRVAEGLAGRAGLEVRVQGMTATARAAAVQDPVLDRIMQEGCEVPADLWWRVYDCAQTALLPDSALSRRHAGPVIVTEDGRIIGRKDNDDDTDVGFIGADGDVETQGKTA